MSGLGNIDQYYKKDINQYPLLRKPYDSEDEYMKKNPHVGGMMTEDGKIILNSYSKLSDIEKDSVYRNEEARINIGKFGAPTFQLTDEQNRFLDTTDYKNANDEQKKSTIAARILAGDPSAKNFTDDQKKYVESLSEFINESKENNMKNDGLGKLTTLQVKPIDNKSLEPEVVTNEIKNNDNTIANGLGKLDIRDSKIKSVGGVRG